MRRFLALIALLFLPAATGWSQQAELPSFGEGNAVSLSQEYMLGRAWLMSFRRQAPVLNDPILEDYIEELVFRLAVSSQLRERRLELVLVDNKSINAFAVPGGVVGVHNGLVMKADTEAQLASVLGHELAHLSQRHFARGLENQQRSGKMNMAGLLAGLVLVAAGGGEAGMAAMAGSQAAAMDSQLRYSRLHEQEADRIGMQNLVNAGMDPRGSAQMFEIMLQEARLYSRPPEFLSTHPVTESRVADARNRAATYPQRMYQDNPQFQLMKARVEYSFYEDPKAAAAHFRERRDQGGRGAVAAQYALVLALTDAGEFREARSLIQRMVDYAPSNMTYRLAEVNIDIAEKKYSRAIAKLERGLKVVPENHPITMYLARAYFEAGRYTDADRLLSAHTRNKPTNAHLWYVLAEVQGLAGNNLGLHQSRAEYFALNGALGQGIEQLKLALPLARDNVTREKIQRRIEFFNQVGAALQQL